MLEEGFFYCMECQTVQKVDSCLWTDHTNNITFGLKKNGINYQVDPDSLHTFDKNLDKVRVKRVEHRNGYPKKVTVEYSFSDDRKIQVTLRDSQRICRQCFNNGYGRLLRLMPDAGYYPSCYIGLVGVMETGKTLFKNSLSQTENFFTSDATEISSLYISGEYSERYKQGYVDAPQPTTLEQTETACFTIRRNGKDFMKVYLTDTAGELSDLEQHETEKANKACNYIADVSDALLVVLDPRYIHSDDLEEYKAARKPIKGSYSLIKNECSHRCIPCGMIMTGSDRLKDICLEKNGIHDRNKNTVITSFCELLENQSLTKENLSRHCALAGDILKSFGIETRISSRNGTFLISSGRDDKINGKTVIRYDLAVNVKYPIAWILNQLGIINIE